MRATYHDVWVATAASAAIAMTLLFSCSSSKSRANEKEVAAAEDEVYETVVRDMVSSADGYAIHTQLVFDDTVLAERAPGADIKSCKERARKNLRLENRALPYNSVADKVYRLLTRSDYADPLRADTVQDFLEKSCTIGRLSQTFHTDLPRTFIAAEAVQFNDRRIEKNGPKSFEQLFPGASGIISFSHVGFDSALHEAIVSTSFVCGHLCGSGSSRYILRKKSGRWKVVNNWIVWVS